MQSSAQSRVQTGSILRVLGGTALIATGLFSAISTAGTWATTSSLMGGDLGGGYRALTAAVGVVSVAGVFLTVLAWVLLAASRGPGGLAGRRWLVTVAFLVLAVVVLVAQLIVRFAVVAAGMLPREIVPALLTGTALLDLAALVFAAIAVAVAGAVRGPARFALFLPVLLQLVAQLSSFGGLDVFYAAQVVAALGWVVVGVVYALARAGQTGASTSTDAAAPRVTPASGNLAQ